MEIDANNDMEEMQRTMAEQGADEEKDGGLSSMMSELTNSIPGIDEAMSFSEQHNLAFIETSALDASGVDTAFQRILTEIYRLMSRRNVAAEEAKGAPSLAGQSISLGGGNANKGSGEKRGCC